MNEYESLVRDFHLKTDGVVDKPLSVELLQLRRRLIEEEVKELFAEIDRAVEELKAGGQVTRKTYLDLLKEMADVQYVLSGGVASFGLPLQKVFHRVHESNLSKLGHDGRPLLREDGKILKGPNYHPPVLDDIE